MKYKEGVERNVGVQGGCGPQRLPGLAGRLQLRGCLEADGGEIRYL